MSSAPSPYERSGRPERHTVPPPQTGSDTRSRSGSFAAWATAWLRGRASYDEVLEQVTGADEPHKVGETDVPLGWFLSELRRRGTRTVRVLLPVPGDARGLPAGTEFAAAAWESGEAVRTDSGIGLVPRITVHGSAIGSRTVLVHWDTYEIPDSGPDPLSVAEAEHDLTDAIRDTASELGRLDVASWSPQIAGALAVLRAGQDMSAQLPPGHDSRALRLLAQADRLMMVLQVADADSPGGSLTAAEARTRAELLRPLGTAVRRARMAAYNGGADVTSPHS